MSSPQALDRVPAPVRIRRARPRWPVLIAVIGLAAVAAGAASVVRRPVQFSADFVNTLSVTYGDTPTRTETTTGIYYAKGRDMRRVESTTGSSQTIAIEHGDKFWSLDPAAKTYYLSGETTPERKAELRAASRRAREHPQAGSRRSGAPIPTETVNGYLCEKRAVDSANMTGWGWFSPRLDLIVKWETTMRSEVPGATLTAVSRREYRNIRERRLPSSLFDVPKDYRKVPPPAARYGQPEQPAGH